MEIDRIARLMALLEVSNIAELELVEGDTRLRLVRGAPRSAAPLVAPPEPAPAATPAEAPEPSSPKTRHTIRAGFPGTFYRAPAPGAPPYVMEGDAVEEGNQLAILEAMKTMNPVEADRGGRVARILADDGAAVEAGAALFEIETGP